MRELRANCPCLIQRRSVRTTRGKSALANDAFIIGGYARAGSPNQSASKQLARSNTFATSLADRHIQMALAPTWTHRLLKPGESQQKQGALGGSRGRHWPLRRDAAPRDVNSPFGAPHLALTQARARVCRWQKVVVAGWVRLPRAAQSSLKFFDMLALEMAHCRATCRRLRFYKSRRAGYLRPL